MGKTLAEKILGNASGGDVKAGDIVIASVNTSFVQDTTGPLTVRQFQASGFTKLANAGSTRLFRLRPGDEIALELPYGDLWLRPGTRPVLMVAGGTGISAVLPLVRHLADGAHEAGERAVHVVYGAATSAIF